VQCALTAAVADDNIFIQRCATLNLSVQLLLLLLLLPWIMVMTVVTASIVRD